LVPALTANKEETVVDVIQPSSQTTDLLERETIKKVAWRAIPILALGYFAAYVDRVNVGMAAPTMMPDFGWSSAQFGFGSGLFFFGYVAGAIPCTLAVNRVGLRRGIAAILVIWGVLSGLTAFVWNDWSFYGIRILLGIGETGFFPAVMLYISWWFPSQYRSRMIALFYSSSTISLIIGPPIGGLLLQMHGLLGLRGWQWLFLLDATPAIIVGILTWWFVTDRPNQATWLTSEQRNWLSERLTSEHTRREAIKKYTLGEVFIDRKVWYLSIALFGNVVAIYGAVVFLPLIVKGLGTPTNLIGTVSAIPYLFAFVGMLYWGWHSDRSGERIWHAASAWLLCAAGMAACAVIGVGHPVATMIALTVALVGQASCFAIYWTLPTILLTGTAAAGGFGFINTIASCGGLFGPWMFGLVRDATHNDNIALLCLAAAPVMSATMILVAGRDRRLERMSLLKKKTSS
jgi:MFS family permease